MKLVWKWIKAPFVWIKNNIKDWRTMVIFLIVMVVVSSSVWIPALIGIICNNTWLIGVATTIFIWWQLPGSPFLFICLGITIGIKALVNKIRGKNENKDKQIEETRKEQEVDID